MQSSISQRNIVATKPEFLVAKKNVLVTLPTMSVAISIPVQVIHSHVKSILALREHNTTCTFIIIHNLQYDTDIENQNTKAMQTANNLKNQDTALIIASAMSFMRRYPQLVSFSNPCINNTRTKLSFHVINIYPNTPYGRNKRFPFWYLFG